MSWRHLPHQWVASMYVAGISMTLFFWLGKILGPALFGQYNYALTWAAMVAVIFDGGFKTLIFREEIKSRTKGIMICQAIGHLLTIVGLSLVGWIVCCRTYTVMWLAVIISVAVNTVVSFYSSSLKAKGAFRTEAMWQIIFRSVSAASILVCVYLWPTPVIIFWAGAMGLLACLCFIWQWFRTHRPIFQPDLAVYRSAMALMVIDIATSLYFRIDIILLNHLNVSQADIGRYAAAVKILQGFVLLSMPVSQIFFREMRIHWLEGTFFLKRLFSAISLSVVLAVTTAALSCWIGEYGIVQILGKSFREAANVLPWLMISLIFIFPNALLTNAALAAGGEWFYAMATIFAAIANITLNFWLIPGYGIMGAAWATIATEACLSAGLLTAIERIRYNFKTNPLPQATYR